MDTAHHVQLRLGIVRDHEGRPTGWLETPSGDHRDFSGVLELLGLLDELAAIGFISPGSLVSRTTSCAKPRCRCQAHPPNRHGPYYQWSSAIGGKTVSRRLGEQEAALYREWIGNRRRLERIVTEMAELSAAAGEILLRQAAACSQPAKR